MEKMLFYSFKEKVFAIFALITTNIILFLFALGIANVEPFIFLNSSNKNNPLSISIFIFHLITQCFYSLPNYVYLLKKPEKFI